MTHWCVLEVGLFQAAQCPFDRIRFNHTDALLKAPCEPYATLLQVCYKPKGVIVIITLAGVWKWMH